MPASSLCIQYNSPNTSAQIVFLTSQIIQARLTVINTAIIPYKYLVGYLRKVFVCPCVTSLAEFCVNSFFYSIIGEENGIEAMADLADTNTQ